MELWDKEVRVVYTATGDGADRRTPTMHDDMTIYRWEIARIWSKIVQNSPK